MEATITKQGELIVKAKTELEQYALEKWCDDNVLENKVTNIIFDYSGEDE